MALIGAHSSNFAKVLPNVTLMLLGKTGAGKSSLGNAILELSGSEAFVVTDGFCSTPIYRAEVKSSFVHGRRVKVVDTPGVQDTNLSSGGGEQKVLEGISNGISLCTEGVDAFLIVLRLDRRLTNEEFDTIDKLERVFGPSVWRHVILVFTAGDDIDNNTEKFQKMIDVAKSNMSSMADLFSKVKTELHMVDSSKKRQPDVINKQITRLMFSVDLLVTENKTKYTSELFNLVKAELGTQRTAQLEAEKGQAEEEIQKLRTQLAGLTRLREEDELKINELEEKAQEVEKEMEEIRTGASKKAAKKWCFFL